MRQCAWPGDESCTEEAEPKRPYCKKHERLAHMPKPAPSAVKEWIEGTVYAANGGRLKQRSRW